MDTHFNFIFKRLHTLAINGKGHKSELKSNRNSLTTNVKSKSRHLLFMASGVGTHTHAHTHACTDTHTHTKVISRNQAHTGHRLACAWLKNILCV